MMFSLLVAQSMLWPSISWAFTAFPAADIPVWRGHELSVPDQLGSIAAWKPGSGPLIIHIQDLHCHYEVQKNIARLIDRFAAKTGLGLVAVEGAAGPVRTSILKDFPLPEARNQVSDYFVRQGKVTGPEYYDITGQRGIRLVGIEDAEAYAESGRLIHSFFTHETQGWLLDAREQLENIKPKLYSRSLLAFDRRRSAYRDGTMGLLKYVRFVEKALKKQGVSLSDYSAIVSYTANRGRFSEAVTPDLLDRQLEQADQVIRAGFYQETRERELDGCGRRLERLERLLNISATPADVAAYRSEAEAHQPGTLAAWLRGQGLEPNEAWLELEPRLRAAEAFYRLADRRSQAFLDNLQACLASESTQACLLVTGGFHTPALLAEAERRGCAILSLAPRLTRQDWANPYFDRLSGRRTPLQKWLADNQAFYQLPTEFWVGAENQPAPASLPHPIRLFYQEATLNLIGASFLILKKGRVALGEFRRTVENVLRPLPEHYEVRVAWERWNSGDNVRSSRTVPVTFPGRAPLTLVADRSVSGLNPLQRVDLGAGAFQVYREAPDVVAGHLDDSPGAPSALLAVSGLSHRLMQWVINKQAGRNGAYLRNEDLTGLAPIMETMATYAAGAAAFAGLTGAGVDVRFAAWGAGLFGNLVFTLLHWNGAFFLEEGKITFRPFASWKTREGWNQRARVWSRLYAVGLGFLAPYWGFLGADSYSPGSLLNAAALGGMITTLLHTFYNRVALTRLGTWFQRLGLPLAQSDGSSVPDDFTTTLNAITLLLDQGENYRALEAMEALLRRIEKHETWPYPSFPGDIVPLLNRIDRRVFSPVLRTWRNGINAGMDIRAIREIVFQLRDLPRRSREALSAIGPFVFQRFAKRFWLNPANFQAGTKWPTIIIGPRKQYRIGELLGKGRYGEVYQGVRLGNHEPVAIKISEAKGSKFVILKEIIMHAGLHGKKGIGPCSDAGWWREGDNEFIYLAMPLNGPTLKNVQEELLIQKKIAESRELKALRSDVFSDLDIRTTVQAMDIMMFARNILATLGELHQAGYLHMDLRPENILLPRRTASEGGGVEYAMPELIDFGLSTMIPDEGVLHERHLVGMPAWSAPECNAHYRYSVQSDLYAIGEILYRWMQEFPEVSLPREFHAFVAALREEDVNKRLRTTREALAALEKIIPDPDRMTEPRVPVNSAAASELASLVELTEESALFVGRQELIDEAVRQGIIPEASLAAAENHARWSWRSRPGVVIGGRYALQGVLDRKGSFSDVFTALDLETGEHAVVKVAKDPLANLHLLREILVLKQLAGMPERISLRDAGSFADPLAGRLLYAVLEPGGGNLQQALDDNLLSEREIVRVLADSWGALARLHARGFVHGNPTLPNILLGAPDDSGKRDVRLVDFGMARRVSRGDARAYAADVAELGRTMAYAVRAHGLRTRRPAIEEWLDRIHTPAERPSATDVQQALEAVLAAWPAGNAAEADKTDAAGTPAAGLMDRLPDMTREDVEAQAEALMAGVRGGWLRRVEISGEFDQLHFNRQVAQAFRLAGKYEVTRKIRDGYFSVVYEARDLDSGERVAVKMSEGRGQYLMLLKEMAVLKKLQGIPFLPMVREQGYCTGPKGKAWLYIVTDLADGDLDEYLTQEKPSEADLSAFFLRLLGSLRQAQARNIIHCDIKSDNILFSRRDGIVVPVLADWNTAMRLPAGGVVHLPGKSSFAPESYRQGEWTARSDVFALGLTLHDALRQRRLAGADPSLDQAVAGMLREDPKERFTAAEAAEALQPWLARRDAARVSLRRAFPPSLFLIEHREADLLDTKAERFAEARGKWLPHAAIQGPADKPALIGNRYRLENPIGWGMGSGATVYSAHDMLSGRPVAVKVGRADISGMSLLREIGGLSAARECAGSAGMLDAGWWANPADPDKPYLYIVMEKADASLEEALRSEKLTPARLLELTRGVLRALHDLHERNLVHRDLRPSNILLRRTGPGEGFDWAQPLLGDLGRLRSVAKTPGEPLDQDDREPVRMDLRAVGELVALLEMQKKTPNMPQAFDDIVSRLLNLGRNDDFFTASEALGELRNIDTTEEASVTASLVHQLALTVLAPWLERRPRLRGVVRVAGLAGLALEIPLLLWLAAPAQAAGLLPAWLALPAQSPAWLNALGFPAFLTLFAGLHVGLMRLRGETLTFTGLVRQMSVLALYGAVYFAALTAWPGPWLPLLMAATGAAHVLYDGLQLNRTPTQAIQSWLRRLRQAINRTERGRSNGRWNPVKAITEARDQRSPTHERAAEGHHRANHLPTNRLDEFLVNRGLGFGDPQDLIDEAIRQHILQRSAVNTKELHAQWSQRDRPDVVIAGHYHLAHVLSREGTFSDVFQALDRVSGQRVVVKVVKGRLSNAHLLKDILVTRELTGEPGVVPLQHAGCFSDPRGGRLLYAVFEPGGINVNQADHRGGLDDRGRLRLLEDISAILERLHARGYTHNNLTPANILVATTPDRGAQTIRVTDFGWARRITADPSLRPEEHQKGKFSGDVADLADTMERLLVQFPRLRQHAAIVRLLAAMKNPRTEARPSAAEIRRTLAAISAAWPGTDDAEMLRHAVPPVKPAYTASVVHQLALTVLAPWLERRPRLQRVVRVAGLAGLALEIPLLLWLAAPAQAAGLLPAWLALPAEAPAWLNALGFPAFLTLFAGLHVGLMRLRGETLKFTGLARQMSVLALYGAVYFAALTAWPGPWLALAMLLVGGLHLVYDRSRLRPAAPRSERIAPVVPTSTPARTPGQPFLKPPWPLPRPLRGLLLIWQRLRFDLADQAARRQGISEGETPAEDILNQRLSEYVQTRFPVSAGELRNQANPRPLRLGFVKQNFSWMGKTRARIAGTYQDDEMQPSLELEPDLARVLAQGEWWREARVSKEIAQAAEARLARAEALFQGILALRRGDYVRDQGAGDETALPWTRASRRLLTAPMRLLWRVPGWPGLWLQRQLFRLQPRGYLLGLLDALPRNLRDDSMADVLAKEIRHVPRRGAMRDLPFWLDRILGAANRNLDQGSPSERWRGMHVCQAWLARIPWSAQAEYGVTQAGVPLHLPLFLRHAEYRSILRALVKRWQELGFQMNPAVEHLLHPPRRRTLDRAA